MVRRCVNFMRKWIYRFGGRPKRKSIFYSPSLSLIYGFRDATKHNPWKH